MPLFDPTERPTQLAIESEEHYLLKIWQEGGAWDDMKLLDKYYFQEVNIWENVSSDVAKNRPNYNDARAVSIVEHAVDAHMALHPTFHRAPLGRGKEHEEAADRIEDGLRAIYSNTFNHDMNLPPKLNGKQIVRHNYTQLYTYLDSESAVRPEIKTGESGEAFEERMDAWAARNRTWNPIRIAVPAPFEVLMDPTQKRPEIAIRRRKIMAYDLHHLTTMMNAKGSRAGTQTWAEIFEIDSNGPEQDVDVIEWFSADWYGLMKKGGGLHVVDRNLTRFQPFCHTFGGAADLKAGEAFNPKWFIRQSMLWRVMEPLKMLWQATAAYHEVIQNKAWFKRTYDGNVAKAAQELKGDIVPAKKDQYGILDSPDLEAHAYQHMDTLVGGIERDTYSLIVSGLRDASKGVETATGVMIYSESAARTFLANVTQMEGMYSISGGDTLCLTESMAKFYSDAESDQYKSIDLGEFSLKVKDIGGNYSVQAKFEQVDAAVAMQQQQNDLVLLEKGVIDEDTFYARNRFDNPSKIRKGRVKDMVRKMPEVQQEWMLVAMREEKYLALAARLEQEAKLNKLRSGLVDAQGNPLFQQNGNGGGQPVPTNGAANVQ